MYMYIVSRQAHSNKDCEHMHKDKGTMTEHYNGCNVKEQRSRRVGRCFS